MTMIVTVKMTALHEILLAPENKNPNHVIHVDQKLFNSYIPVSRWFPLVCRRP